jgi:hypothetical protein
MTSNNKIGRASSSTEGAPRKSFRSFDEEDFIRKSAAHAVESSDLQAAFPSEEDGSTATGNHSMRSRAGSLVADHRFELFITFVIASNAVLLGVEIECTAGQVERSTDVVFFSIQCCYSTIFLVELMLRLWVDGRAFLCGSTFLSGRWAWNYLDLLIVILSVFEVVVEAIRITGLASGSGTGLANLSVFRIVRMCRVLRIIRITRTMRFIRSLRTLVQSIFGTLKALSWALLLLVMIMYVFAILLTNAAQEYAMNESSMDGGPPGVCSEGTRLCHYWGSLPNSMRTLFKVVSGGVNWEIVADPLLEMHPAWEYLLAAYIAFVSFAVMNVVTGFFCQSALESTSQDQELVVQELVMDRQKWVQKLQDLFRRLDVDKSGFLTIKEFECLLRDDRVQGYFSSMELDTSDAWALFKLLVNEDTHVVYTEDFVEGCLRLKGNAKGMDMAKLLHDNKFLLKKLSAFMTYVETQFALTASHAPPPSGTGTGIGVHPRRMTM